MKAATVPNYRSAGVMNCNMAVKVEGGSRLATDKSYGVHVVKLAGFPEAVIREG